MTTASKKDYTGIDIFRVIASLLVIAIHTSPLKDLSQTFDFILTRVTARIAVPFFHDSGVFPVFRGRRFLL